MILIHTCRKRPSPIISVCAFAVAVALLSLAYVSPARAIELSDGCKKVFEKFENWNSYFKVFAYGLGKVRGSACETDITETDALRKCNKWVKPWGGECKVYAKSPVNGKMEIVWKDAPSSNRSKKFEQNSNKAICSMAMTARRAEWDDTELAKEFRIEADRRHLSLLQCQKALGIHVANAEKDDPFRILNARAERQNQIEAETRRRLGEAERADKSRLKAFRQSELAKMEADRKAGRERKIAEAREKLMAPLREKHWDAIAVIIGNKNYKSTTPAVDFAHNDADAVKRFLIDKLAYRDGNIIDLRDATRNEIEEVFGNDKTHEGQLFDWIKPGVSDVIVYFSGHGVPGLKDKRPYLLPVDGNANRAEITGFPVDVLYDNLANTPAHSVTVYLDACFSGESPKGMLVQATSGVSVSPRMPSSKARMTVITAAQGDQFASWDEKAKHGLFTKHLLLALNGKADSKKFGNADGEVSLQEVQRYLDDVMTYQARRTWGRRQQVTVQGSAETVLAAVITAFPNSNSISQVKPANVVYQSKHKSGDAFKDCDNCPEMVVVPAGSFQMGDLSGDGDPNEKPVHRVAINYSFAVGKFETTIREWNRCVAQSVCVKYKPTVGDKKSDKEPVFGITWKEAKTYLDWLSNETGKKYRLPSEAEWEYAARAGTSTPYHFGYGAEKTSARLGTGEGLVEVGRFPANAFGLHDMHGNATEWTEDCWNDSHFGAPTDGSPRLTGNCLYNVVRGGHWRGYTKDGRSSSRSKDNAGGTWYGKSGFRVARTLSR